jgi:ribonucleotide monophosphatase NagD (HAD superfamily)
MVNNFFSDQGIPHIYLTNGGGMTEIKKAKQLSEWFDVHVNNKYI